MSGVVAHRSFPAESRNISRPGGPDHLAKLFESGSRHYWGRHQMLFRAGDPATSLHRITSGVVAVSITMPDARRQIIVFLFTGDPCGLVQSNGRYAFDYEAITETTTCAVNMSHVRKVTISDPDVARAVKEKMSRTEARLTEQLVAIGQLNAKERVVHFLRRLSQSYAERGMPTQPLLLPMTRLDIADHLGLRLETVSRVLTQLQRRDVIDLQDANTVVLSPSIGEFANAAPHY
jgi:CRP-like cAMP-binding protein